MNNGPFENYRFVGKVPEGDDKPRMVCGDCGWIHYVNPKIIVGLVAGWEGKILLCRRAIEPRVGYWTMPAGFMEEGESTEHGAAREAWEEARARVEIDALLGVYSVPRLSQVHIMYRARLLTPEVDVGPESLEVALFDWSEIPWDELAFPIVGWSLRHYHEVEGQTVFRPFCTPPEFSPAQKSFEF